MRIPSTTAREQSLFTATRENLHKAMKIQHKKPGTKDYIFSEYIYMKSLEEAELQTDRKQVDACLSQEWEQRLVGMRGLFDGDDGFLSKLDCCDGHNLKFTKTVQIIHLQWVGSMVCKIHFIKTLKSEKSLFHIKTPFKQE